MPNDTGNFMVRDGDDDRHYCVLCNSVATHDGVCDNEDCVNHKKYDVDEDMTRGER